MVQSLRQHRNSPCSCGSGKKHKNCCGQSVVAGQPERRNSGMWAGLAVVGLALAAGAAWKLGGSSEPASSSMPLPVRPPPLQVNSGGNPIDVKPMGAGAMTPQPPGEAPPGKVWSPEHGHWHDVETVTTTVGAGGAPAPMPAAAPTPVAGQLIPEPPGGTPPGKIWSPEHGHYHDLPSASPAVPAAAPEPVPAPLPTPVPAPITPGS